MATARMGRPRGSKTKKPTSAKSETLTIRIEPRTRFMLDFMARHREQTITKIIERAVKEFAEKDENLVADRGHPLASSAPLRHWADYWHPHEGVRAVRLCVFNGPDLDQHEEELREFILAHVPFFFEYQRQTDEDGDNLSAANFVFYEPNIMALWDRLDNYQALWLETRAEDRWAAGAAMKKALEDAGYSAPPWPPPPGQRPSGETVFEIM